MNYCFHVLNALNTTRSIFYNNTRGAYIFPETTNIEPIHNSMKSVINIDLTEDYFGSSEGGSTKEMTSAFNELKKNLLSGNKIDSANYNKFTQYLSKPLGRNCFIDVIDNFGLVTFIKSWECFKTLSKLMIHFLDEVEKEKDHNIALV